MIVKFKSTKTRPFTLNLEEMLLSWTRMHQQVLTNSQNMANQFQENFKRIIPPGVKFQETKKPTYLEKIKSWFIK